MAKVAGGRGKQPIRQRGRLSESALAANRANAAKGGRPAGKMNAEKIALRDRIRAREEEIVSHMFHLAFHGESESVQLGALHGLFDRGWGRPVQPHDGDGEGGPITFLVNTGVPEPDQARRTICSLNPDLAAGHLDAGPAGAALDRLHSRVLDMISIQSFAANEVKLPWTPNSLTGFTNVPSCRSFGPVCLTSLDD